MPGAIDPPALRRAMSLYAEALRRHRDELDSLNVYPVPDGDTGTNMLLTQQAVMSALDAHTGTDDLGPVVARASLMGARGNSGVILSQALRGLFAALSEGRPDGAGVAGALRRAADEAYRAVARPMEGTVLSVLRDAAEAGEAAVRDPERHADRVMVLESVVAAGSASLDRTRETLPELRKAGVVDAGAKGMVLLFDALLAAVAGSSIEERAQTPGPVGRPVEKWAPTPGPVGRPPGERIGPGLEHPYEVQYLLEGSDSLLPSLRARLAGLGDSLVVVGGGGLYNVHVHTAQPGKAVEAALEAGRPRDISIAWLEGQVEDCIAGQARAVRMLEQIAAMVAVAEGRGLTETFRSLGAVVVPGGPGRAPSVGDLLTAIEAAPAAAVLVLPNDPNVLPAAERAAGESAKEARVVRSLSMPAGMAAASAFNPTETLERNAEEMAQAVSPCVTGAMARAVRDADTPAGSIRKGEWIGLVDGEPVGGGEEVAEHGGRAEDVAVRLVRRMVSEGSEIITVVTGSDATMDDRRQVESGLRRAFPHVEVQVVDGEQPRYPFLIGVE